MNPKRLLIVLLLVVCFCAVAAADTLYLKNGSVLQGNFLRMDNGQVFFQLTTGGDRDRGRVLRFPIADVLRIVTDRDPDGTLSRVTGPGSNAPRGAFTTHPAFDVTLAADWIDSGIQVVKGQQIRITATGQVTLDGRTRSSPEGINQRDPNAPLPDQNDGALLASITNDISAPIVFVGKSSEFEADRDGTLFFTVNHWEYRDARGSYQVRVQTERSGNGPARPYDRGAFACANLPDRFTETENGYNSVWTRRGQTNEYDAVWTLGRNQVTAVVTVRTEGNRFFAKRVSSSDGYLFDYEGTIAADGVSISGTATFSGNTFPFRATAECNR